MRGTLKDTLPFGDGFRDRLREDIGKTELPMILGEVDASATAFW
jgi:hypothetical protein